MQERYKSKPKKVAKKLKPSYDPSAPWGKNATQWKVDILFRKVAYALVLLTIIITFVVIAANDMKSERSKVKMCTDQGLSSTDYSGCNAVSSPDPKGTE